MTRPSLPHPSRAGRSLIRPLALLVVAVGIGALIWPEFRSAPPITDLLVKEGIDAEILRLVAAKRALCEESPRDAERRRDLALVYEAQGLWDQAIPAWDAALSLDGDQPVWRYHLAAAYHEQGEMERTRELLTEVLRARPGLGAAQYRLGVVYRELGRVPEAKAAFTQASVFAPKAPHAWVGLAEVAMMEDDYVRAVEYGRKAVGLDANYRQAHFVLGTALRGEGRREEAERELTLGLNSTQGYLGSPLSAQVKSYVRGTTAATTQASRYLANDQPEKAIPLLLELRRQDPTDLVTLVNLGAAYIDSSQYEKARVVMLEAHELEPSHYGVLTNLAATSMRLGRLEEAEEQVRKALKIAPEVSSVHKVRGQILTQQARLEEAYAAFRRAGELDRTDGECYASMGELSVRLDNFELACENFTECARLEPNNVSVRIDLAQASMQAGRREEASKAYREAVAIDPEHPRVKQFQRMLEQIRQRQQGEGR